jgi:hypothetical protein
MDFWRFHPPLLGPDRTFWNSVDCSDLRDKNSIGIPQGFLHGMSQDPNPIIILTWYYLYRSQFCIHCALISKANHIRTRPFP